MLNCFGNASAPTSTSIRSNSVVIALIAMSGRAQNRGKIENTESRYSFLGGSRIKVIRSVAYSLGHDSLATSIKYINHLTLVQAIHHVTGE